MFFVLLHSERRTMKYRLLIISLFLFATLPTFSQRKRAFMVGVSHYDTALTDYQWNNINGVNDIELLSPLLKRQGFQIVSLVDNQATFDSITKELGHFIKNSKAGDIVYLHFSTHGQPVEDKNGDESDGWDEAIVPIDANKLYSKGEYEGERHLLDDQLNKYIQQLRRKIGKKGIIYVVIDACHAGTSSRANDNNIRGTRVGLSATNKVFKPSKERASHFQLSHASKLADVLFLEACRADQINSEIKVDEKWYGALSFHIAKTLQNNLLSVQPSKLVQSLQREILQQGMWPNNQNLVIETSIPQ